MATRLIALVVLALSLLPIANILPGGETDPEYLAGMLGWLNGLALCAGVGVLVAYVTRVRRRGAPLAAASGIQAGTSDSAFAVVLVLASFALYALIAQFVFSGRPLLIDEVVQVLQGRWYAGGRISVPAPAVKEFFSIMHVVDLGDRVYGQFPAGGPAMLALGSLVGAEWLVGPAVGAVSVALFAILLPELEPGASLRWRRGTAVLFALAPFGAFMFGSHMNHATTLMWLLLAVVALAHATKSVESSMWWGLLTGLGLGVAATIRPMDAVAFALPAGAWLLWRARTGGRPLATLLLSGVGIAVPLSALMWVNSGTTGAPLLFGYEVLWGSGHSLGFHQPPWGPPHTPLRGLELVSIYFTRLSNYLLETPFPALLLVAGGLWLTPKLRPLDKYLLGSAGLTVVGYWAYWHDGFFLGPRFVFPLLPVLVLWTARFPLRVGQLTERGSALRLGMQAALGAGVVMSAISLASIRIPEYRNGLTSMRFDVERESAMAGVRDALVLVKESWGSRLVVRLWALGVSRAESERLYRYSDACKLELTISELERSRVSREQTFARLRSLLADSALVVRSTRSKDVTEGMLPGHAYAAVCEAQIAADWSGYYHLAPFLLAQDGNVYARWMPGREAEIAALYPGRTLYRLGRTGYEVSAGPVWERLTLRSAP